MCTNQQTDKWIDRQTDRDNNTLKTAAGSGILHEELFNFNRVQRKQVLIWIGQI